MAGTSYHKRTRPQRARSTKNSGDQQPIAVADCFIASTPWRQPSSIALRDSAGSVFQSMFFQPSSIALKPSSSALREDSGNFEHCASCPMNALYSAHVAGMSPLPAASAIVDPIPVPVPAEYSFDMHFAISSLIAVAFFVVSSLILSVSCERDHTDISCMTLSAHDLSVHAQILSLKPTSASS